MPRDRTLARPAAVLLAVGLAAAACTGGGTPAPTPTARARALTGHVLLASGPNDQGLTDYRLPNGPSRELRLPDLGQYDFWTGGVLGKGSRKDRIYVMAGQRHAQLYEVSADHAPVKVGPVTAGNAGLVAVTERFALASSCNGPNGVLWQLDLDHPTGWKNLGPGCGAAVSPDGTTFAFTPQGYQTGPGGFFFGPIGLNSRVVWKGVVGSSAPPVKAVDLKSLPQLAAAGISKPAIYTMAVGKPGVGILVGNGFESADQFALVVVPPGRPAQVTLLGPAFPMAMAWQPDGPLLMFLECLRCNAFRSGARDTEMRVYDPGAGALREVMVGVPDFAGGAVWSPDGSLLVARRTAIGFTVVDLQGNLLRTVPVQGLPIAWGA